MTAQTQNRYDRLILLADNYAALLDALESGVDATEDGEPVDENVRLDTILAEFRDTGAELETAFDQLVKIDRLLDGQVAEVKAVLGGLREKHSQVVNRKAALRRYLLALLQRADIQKIKTPLGTVYQTRSQSVEVVDMEVLPEEFTKVDISPIKTALAVALKAGREVAGARLVETISVGIR